MDLSQKRNLILHGNMTHVIITLAFPLMLNNLMQTVYNLTDTFWVSKLGDVEVAAITLVWPVFFFFMSLGVGLSIGGTALISQYIGSGRKQEATEVAGQILTFSFWLSLIFGVIGVTMSPFVVKAMGAEGVLLSQATAFLQITFIEIPFMFMIFAYNSIKQGEGNTLTPMILSGLSVGLNIILDPIFIFTFGLGIRGAAWATVLSRAIFTVYAIHTLFYKSEGIRLKWSHLHWNTSILNKILVIGIPSSIGQSTTALGFGLLNAFIISYGSNSIAAFGIGNRVNSLVLMPVMGIGNALATIVGQNLGADQVQRAKKAVHHSMVFTTLLMIVGGAFLFVLSPLIIRQFSNNPDVIRQGTYYLRLISLSLPLMGFFQIFIGTFQGSGHTISAMVLMMGRLWGLRIPLILLFKNYTDWGSNGIWYAMNLSNLFVCLVGVGIYSTGKWQQKVIKKRSMAIEELEEVTG